MNSKKQFQWELVARRLIVLVAVLCTTAPLVFYLIFSLEKQTISMSAEADIFARMITDEINNNPDYWQYEDLRFSYILSHRLHDRHYLENRQLFDNNDRMVAGNNNSLQWPLATVEVPVFDAGVPVGFLRVTRSLRSILAISAVVFFVSSLCGVLVYFALHVFPLKVLRSAFAALHKEKEQAIITLQSIADAVITTDTSLKLLSLNPAAEQLAGVQSARVLGEPFQDYFEIVHSETREKVETLFEECLGSVKNPGQLKQQAILVGKGQKGEFQVEVKVSPLHDEQARLLGFVVVFHDVTDTHVLERQLKEKVRELAVIVKSAGVGIAFVREGIVQEVNTLASQIIGLPANRIIGQQAISILTRELGYTYPTDLIYERLSRGEIFDMEHQIVREGQDNVWVRLIGQGVDPRSISAMGTVWIIQDISQLKQYQEGLQTARFKAEEASRFKSEFLAHVNHELRNPLGGIIGMVRLLLDTELTSVQRQYLTIIENAAAPLLQLINNLLDLSKIEAGVMELEEKPFRISSIFEYVQNLVAQGIKDKGLSLNLSTSADVPEEIIGDQLRLGQILLNLVGNAQKFTSTGGINVWCEKISQTESTIELQFNVTDTGGGIDEAARKKIFEAFMQESSSVARMHGGSGLGLTICKNLVELMNGHIWLESEPGKGSTFSFTGWFKYQRLSQVGSTAAEKKASGRNEGLRKQKRRILLVDDIPFNQTIAKLFLERDSHCVHLADNGREALVALAKSTYDVIFMDVEMPVMDGLIATRLIRRCEKDEKPLAREDNDLIKDISSMIYGKHIPIVGMTGNATEDGRLECLTAGMDDCISKPYEEHEILRVLGTVL